MSSLVPGPLLFLFSFCLVYYMEVEEPLLCIILNPNKRTKTGEAWNKAISCIILNTNRINNRSGGGLGTRPFHVLY